MHTLASQHYLRQQKRGKKERPAWLQRLDKSPAHWSGPAARFQESLIRLNGDLSLAIRTSPAPVREALVALQAMTLQLMRMVSEGVIRGIVEDVFWHRCYSQVPVQVEDASKILAVLQHQARVNYSILVELCKAQGKPVPPSLDDELEAALKAAQEAAKAA